MDHAPSIRRRATSWLCLAVQGVAALTFHGLVLCIDGEDHVAVERALAGDCCRQAVASAEDALVVTLAEAPCPCLDTPLVQPVVAGSRAHDAVPVPVLLARAVPRAAPSGADGAGASPRLVDAAIPEPAARAALRSIVLLV